LLADALEGAPFSGYDVVLIDCPPNFNMVTRTAIVASEHILVPAKRLPLDIGDHISASALDTAGRAVQLCGRVESGGEHQSGDPGRRVHHDPVRGRGVMTKLRRYIDLAGETEVPLFQQTVRESKSVFSDAGELGIPAVLAAHTTANVEYDLTQLTASSSPRQDMRSIG